MGSIVTKSIELHAVKFDSGSSASNKYRWEQEFWEQQRAIEQPELNIGMHDKPVMNPLSDSTIPPVMQMENDTESDFKDLISADATNEVKSILRNHQNFEMHLVVSPRQQAASLFSVFNKSDSLTETESRVNERVLPTISNDELKNSMLQVKEHEASIWMRMLDSQDRVKLRSHLIRALDFFGLKLKKLIINGEYDKELSLQKVTAKSQREVV